MNVRLPNIQGSTAQQLSQIKSYLYQLAQELNYAANVGGDAYIAPNTPAGQRVDVGIAPYSQTPQEQFNDLKALIIKSADIVNAYYEEISRRLEGVYVASGDFGTFSEETAAQLTENSTAIEQSYTHLQQILTDLQQSLTCVQAYINTGLLYYDDAGVPVYGMEIGQRTEKDGQTVFHKYARFTSDKLAFYDQAGNEAAYISDRKLRIPNALVETTLTRGGYEDRIDADGSLTTRWVGI